MPSLAIIALVCNAVALVANVFTLWQVLRIRRTQRAMAPFIERIQFLD